MHYHLPGVLASVCVRACVHTCLEIIHKEAFKMLSEITFNERNVVPILIVSLHLAVIHQDKFYRGHFIKLCVCLADT